jgi:ankyrin repeat protein
MALRSLGLSGDDYLSSLPYELLFDIASRLSYPDIQRLCRVSRVFSQLCQDDHFWLILYRRDISTMRPPPSTTIQRTYQQIIAQFSKLTPNWALVKASKNGYENIVDDIVQNGLKLKDDDYNDAMTDAAQEGHWDIVERLVELGATDYNRAMAMAAEGGHRDIVERMVELGATDYNWAMTRAADKGYTDIVERMVELGATYYNGALGYAALSGHRDIVKRMLGLGANIYNNMVLKDVEREGYHDIVQLIQQYRK